MTGRYWRRLLPGGLVLLLFLLHGAGAIELPLLQRLEYLTYDLRLHLTLPGGIDPRIVIVDIDEDSLRREGHWPWDRDKLARLTRNLFEEYRVAVAGFDVVFAERDDNEALNALHARLTAQNDTAARALLDKLRPFLDREQDFAQNLKAHPVLLGYYFTADPAGTRRSGQLPSPVLADSLTAAAIPRPLLAHGYVANLPALQRHAAGAGFFDNPSVDEDGVFRRVPLLQQYNGALYESLALALTRAYLHAPLLPVVSQAASGDLPTLEAVRLGSLRIPVDEEAAALVPFRGPQYSFRYVSASDVLHKTVAAPQALRGAIVLIGGTAPGLLDLRATPVQNVYPGIEMHANLISGILDQRIKYRPDYTRAIDLLQLLVIGLLLAALLPRLSAILASALSLGTVMLVTAANLWFWQMHNMVLPLASVVLLIAGLFVANMAHGFFVEGRAKRQLGMRFGQYVPPELVTEMSHNPQRYTLEGEKREMTVLFSDLRGFTRMSEGLDPKDLSELMNTFLTPMTRIIHEHRGTIDKYMGDAIMAFWGAPLAEPAHATRAIEAALAMNAALADLSRDFVVRGWPALGMGIGLSTGPMSVGNMGSQFRMAYTVLGDTVNLGSRLESQTKNYGVSIIVSEATRRAASQFVYRELDRVRVKGKQQPVAIFEPLGTDSQVSAELRDELTLHTDALAAYRNGKWDRAEKLFTTLQQRGAKPELCKLFLWRIAYLRVDPPATDWGGVFVSRRKGD